MENNQLFLFLASGVIKDKGFWLIGIKNSEREIIDDKTLLECHRKELIGLDSAEAVIDAINLNLENIINDLKNKRLLFEVPPKGFPFNIPLEILENIFDFWLDKYKVQEEWETCLGLLKIRRRVPLTNLIETDSIKGDTKKCALEIENLHTYKPNSIEKTTKNEPMWK